MRLRQLGLVPWWWIIDETCDVTTWRFATVVAHVMRGIT
jgi:hypothetical protein